MVKIEAWSLEEAYTLASKQLECSITEIECEIVQTPSKGFLGIGRKKAILVAVKKQKLPIDIKSDETSHVSHIEQEAVLKTPIKSQPVQGESVHKECAPANIAMTPERQSAPEPKPQIEVLKFDEPAVYAPKEPYLSKSAIDSSFFKESRDIREICEEIEGDINNLFAASCFNLDRIKVEPYDSETALILFSGQDSALLIGKEGYRYKALSYLIFNWVNSKYGLLIRLEIAEFLKNQEEMIMNYLEPLIAQIRETRRGHTKVLDGVLIQIALKILREEFTELYVGVKTNNDGSKYIIVNEFYSKQHDR